VMDLQDANPTLVPQPQVWVTAGLLYSK
jgi:hypothetical protein